MKRTATLLLACTAFGVTAQASAQSLSRGWDSYRQQQKQQTGTQGATAPAAQSALPALPAQAGMGGAPVAVGGSGSGQPGAPGGFTTVTEQPSVEATPVAPAYAPAPPREEEQRLKSGLFLGVQSGKAKVFENVKQDMQGFNVGYR